MAKKGRRGGKRTKRGGGDLASCAKVAVACGKTIGCSDNHLQAVLKAARAEQAGITKQVRDLVKSERERAAAKIKQANANLVAFRTDRAKQVTACRKEIRVRNEEAVMWAQEGLGRFKRKARR